MPVQFKPSQRCPKCGHVHKKKLSERTHQCAACGHTERALKFFGELYDIEREVQVLDPDERRRTRLERSAPVAQALEQWLKQRRQLVPEGSATAKAIDYSLKRWTALTRFIDDGGLPADNNRVENQIRPIAIGRSNWLFAGSLRAGQRAAAVMSLLQSARDGLEPWAYLKTIMERLPTQPASRIGELLPWNAATLIEGRS